MARGKPEETRTMRQQFVEKYVQAVPEQPGIYTLWDHAHPVYIGRTAPSSNLRAELGRALVLAMLEDLTASHFSFEVTHTPKTRAVEELRGHFERWGSLPRYNERAASRDPQPVADKEPVAARR
jgi:hypothetical protein